MQAHQLLHLILEPELLFLQLHFLELFVVREMGLEGELSELIVQRVMRGGELTEGFAAGEQRAA